MKKNDTTAEASNSASRAPAARAIDGNTIAEMAKLCAKNLTESEAARRLSLRPGHWFEWKSRHNRTEKFKELFEAFRAGRIERLLDRIEESAEGKGGVKYADWRAAAALLKFYDSKRFGESPAVEINMEADSARVGILVNSACDTVLKLVGRSSAKALPAPATANESEVKEQS
jgi:hypothetical protein